MYSLDFEEFLWAYGYDANTVEYLSSFYESKDKIPPEINQKFDNILREYLVVGGMPEVVADFIKHKDFGRVQEIQEKIIK